MMLRFATLCTLLAGSASFAQTTVVQRISILRLDDPNLDTYTFGAAECSDTLTLGWSNTLTIGTHSQCSMNDMKLWASAGDSCPETPAATDPRYPSVPSLTLNTLKSGTFTVKISDLPDFKTTDGDGGVLHPCNGVTPDERRHVICGSVEYSTFAGTTCSASMKLTASPLKLVFDTKPPTPPTVTASGPLDQGVRLDFSVDTDTSAVILEVQGPTDVDYRQIAEAPAANLTIRGDKLENNVPYLCRLRAKDAAGNVSEATDPAVSVTPILTLGFWGYYKDVGGTETGGCSVGAGLMPLLLAAFAFRRARKQVRRKSS